MAKKGMKRPDYTSLHPKNEFDVVPELQGKAKTGKKKAAPVISGTAGSNLKVYHQKPFSKDDGSEWIEKGPL